jgi:hypothetical protein
MAPFLYYIAKIFSMKKTKNIPVGNAMKNPDNWKTGDEPITGAQASYLETLASEAQEKVNMALSKAEASKKIEALQHKTGRGPEHQINKKRNKK